MKNYLLLAVCFLFFSTSSAYAGYYKDESNTNKQKQGQLQGQLQGQAQGQGQIQGNLGIQKGNDVNISGDEGDDFKAYSFTAPALSANKGVSELNAYSIFGGIGISSTEEYQVAKEGIELVNYLEMNGYLSVEAAQVEAAYFYAQFKEATKSKRLAGLLWKTRGRHLFNLFGLAATEDLRFNVKKISFKAKPSTADVNDGSGNEGNF